MSKADRFSYRALKDDRVAIYSDGRRVTMLSGRAAVEFLTRVEADSSQAPRLMARATGQYKMGTERR